MKSLNYDFTSYFKFTQPKKKKKIKSFYVISEDVTNTFLKLLQNCVDVASRELTFHILNPSQGILFIAIGDWSPYRCHKLLIK